MRGGFDEVTGAPRIDRRWLAKRLRYEGVGWPKSGAGWRPRGVIVALAVGLTSWGYADIGPRGRNEPGKVEQHQTDFTVFTEAGAAFFDGRDPYQVHNPRGWHYLYPPLFAILVSPLSVLDTQSQVLVWYFFNCLMAFACFAEARRLWRMVSGEVDSRFARRVAACATLTAIFPVLDCMQAGQLGIAILLLLLLGFRLVIQGGSWAARFAGGLILALPAAVKLVPALPVACLAYQVWAAILQPIERRKALARAIALTVSLAVGATVYLVAVPTALIGWEKNWSYLEGWNRRVVTNERVGSTTNFNIHSVRNQSLSNAVYLWNKGILPEPRRGEKSIASADHPEREVYRGVRVVIGAVIGLMLLTGCVVGRRVDPLDQATAYSLACSGMLLVSPLAWGHYYMAEAPAVLVVPLWIWRAGMPRAGAIAAILPVIFTWAYYLSMGTVGALGLLGLGLTTWFIAVSVLILMIEVRARFSGWGEAERRETRLLKVPHWRRFRAPRSSATPARRFDRAIKTGIETMETMDRSDI